MKRFATRSFHVLVTVSLLVLSLALGPSPTSLSAQGEDEGPRETFTDVIDVRVVEVEAVVTDRQGNRVEGLSAEDFRLVVDGEEVPVEYFSEIRHGHLVPRAETVERLDTEPPTIRPAEVEDPGRSFLVFVDDYFTDRRYRHRLLGNLLDNVARMSPRDRMAIVRFEGYGLEMISPWTSDKDELTEAIRTVRKKTPADLIRRTKADIGANPQQRSFVLGRQIREVTSAMAVAMRSLQDVPGRKLLLPVTTGWPFDPTLELGGLDPSAAFDRDLEAVDNSALDQGFGAGDQAIAGTVGGQRGPGLEDLDGSVGSLSRLQDVMGSRNLDLLRPVSDTANLLGFTVYPMHVGDSAAQGGELLRTSLWILARETGGRMATEGAAATLPLVPVEDDTGSYYVLGFSPQRARDDQRHRVELEVVGEGRKVRHRKSFRDLSRRAQLAMQAEEALLLGEGGDLEVTLGELRGRGRSVRLPVVLTIPMDWVTMVPRGPKSEVWQGDLELRVATLDKRGGRSEIPAVPIELQGPEPPPGSHATYEATVEVRNIEQRLVLYLYDKLSGESKVAAVQLDP